MNQLMIGVFALTSLPAMANVDCYLNNTDGAHFEFSETSGLLDTGAPFGVVRVTKVRGALYFSSIYKGEETVIQFKKRLSLTKQKPLGISEGGNAALGNVVCK